MKEPSSAGRRIAFFGGSFDPPHLGHIGIARAARAALQLDTVLFTPVGFQPLKPLGSTATYEDRVAMTELAIQGLPNFAISLVDTPAQSGEPNYTIDTLHRLQAQFPSAQLFTLIGADSFVTLPRWYRGGEIPFIAPLIVASRPGQRLEHMAAMLPDGLTMEEEPGESGNDEAHFRTFTLRNQTMEVAPLYLLDGLQIEISASEIRRQVRAAVEGLCAGHELLPDAVCEYIAVHGLYRNDETP